MQTQLVGCTDLFGVRVILDVLGRDSVVHVFNAQEREDADNTVTTRLHFAPDSIFPCDHDLFGFMSKSRNSFLFYKIQSDFKLQNISSFTLPTKVGFQSEETAVISSFQHFFDPTGRTICFQDIRGGTRIFDLTTQKELYCFRDIFIPFMKMGSLLSGGSIDRWLGTIDLRQKYQGIKASSVGKNLEIHGDFLLINPDDTVIVCDDDSAHCLPRGTLSISGKSSFLSLRDKHHASIYGGNYSLWCNRRYSFTPSRGECIMNMRKTNEEPEPYLMYNRLAKFCFAGNQRVLVLDDVCQWYTSLNGSRAKELAENKKSGSAQEADAFVWKFDSPKTAPF
jgi:hypothetical protein